MILKYALNCGFYFICREMLKTYYKFMVVRHPLDRLVSAYVDKLVPREDGYRKQMGTKILQMLHPHLLERPLPEVWFKFDDVLQFIANGGYCITLCTYIYNSWWIMLMMGIAFHNILRFMANGGYCITLCTPNGVSCIIYCNLLLVVSTE